MAVITSNGTGGGDWSAGATWVGGVAPATGATPDDAVIASGDTVTKDTAAHATADCGALTVTGTLAIAASQGLRMTTSSGLTGTGSITMTDNSRLYHSGSNSGNAISWNCVGSSGNRWEIEHEANTHMWANFSGGATFRWGAWRVYGTQSWVCKNWGLDTVFEDMIAEGGSSGGNYLIWPYTGSTGVRLRRCYIHGGSQAGIYRGDLALGSAIYLEDVVLGETELGTSDPNGTDIVMNGGGIDLFATNTKLSSSTQFNITARVTYRAQGHQQVAGDWYHRNVAGYSYKDATAKKSGDFGISLVPISGIGATAPYVLDIPIPVASGDTVAPSLYVYNATADLNLQDASNRMTFELDPGDEWGLNETIDASSLADVYQNWRLVDFTGGTAGGTSKTGSVLLRITLARYVATGVVYLADMTTT